MPEGFSDFIKVGERRYLADMSTETEEEVRDRLERGQRAAREILDMVTHLAEEYEVNPVAIAEELTYLIKNDKKG